MDYESILLDYIKNELLHGRIENLNPKDDLLGAGTIDSVGILNLVAFMEERFDISIPDEDVVFENFYSAKALADYLVNFGNKQELFS